MAELAHITAVVTATTAQFQSAMAQVNSTVTATAGRMGALASANAGIAASSARVGRSLTKNVTLPVAAAGAAGIAMSVDFESSMAKIEGLVGVAKADVKAMGDQARKLGPQYGKSASEAGDALFFITSAGLRGKDAMDVLEQSLKASAIGLGDTATVADLATSAMNAYGSEVLPASQATDVMIASVREGKLEASELAGAMGMTLPIASNMGVSFDQVGAAFAAMSRTGTNASQAATQLRGILASLKKPTKQANDTLAEYGMSAQGLRDKLRKDGLLPVLKQLTTAFGDNEEAQAMVFGNIRALTGVMDMMGASAGTTEKIFDSLTTTLGDTDKAMAVTAETAGFKMAVAWQSIKQTLMQFGDALLPAVNGIMTALGSIGKAFSALPGPIRTATVGVLGFVAAIGPLMWIGGKVGVSLARLGGSIAATGAATAATTGTVGTLGRALPLLSRAGPVGAAIGGVIGLGIAVKMLRPEFTGLARSQRDVAVATQEANNAADAQKRSFTENNQAIKANGNANAALKNSKKEVKAAEDELRAALNNSKTPTAEIAELTRDLTIARANEAKAASNAARAQSTSVSALTNLISAEDEGTKKLEDRVAATRDAITEGLRYGASAQEMTKRQLDFEAATADLNIRTAETPERLEKIRGALERGSAQIKKSAISDAAKSEALAVIAGAIDEVDNRASALKPISVEVRTEAKKKLKDIEDAGALLDGKVFTFTVFGKRAGASIPSGKPTGGFCGGFIAGYAGGGTVKGPAGRDVIPAMLTAGEVVLTKRQQALVDGGMSIRDAIIKTGGAYAKGGKVSDKERAARDKRKARVQTAGRGLIDSMRQDLGGRISAKFSGGFTGAGGTGFTIGLIEEMRRKQEDNLRAIEASFDMAGLQASIQTAMAAFDKEASSALSAFDKKHAKTMRDFDKTNAEAMEGFQSRATAAIDAVNKSFDEQRNNIEAAYKALTPAEAALKALNESVDATNIADNIADARQALEDARAFGSAKQIKAAQKALDQALIEQQKADLQKQAEQERSEAEVRRSEALTALDEQHQQVLASTQAHHDGLIKAEQERQEAERLLKDEAYEAERAALEQSWADQRAIKEAGYAQDVAARQAAIDAALQQQRDADAQQLALLNYQQEQEKAALDRRLGKMQAHFNRAGALGVNQTNKMVNQLNWFKNRFEKSGHILIGSFARGISKQSPAVAAAARLISKTLRDYLELNSPARKGPLSSLDSWFDAFTPTLLSGMDDKALREAISMDKTTRRGGRNGATTTINLNVSDQTFVGMSREQADRVAREVQAAIERQVRFSI